MQRALDDQLPAVSTGRGSPLTGRSPADEVVLGYVWHQVQAIARYDPLVRRDEPDAVHQMRVATRRARSALQAFGTIIEREATRPLCEELKWLAASSGRPTTARCCWPGSPPSLMPSRPPSALTAVTTR